MNAPADKLLTLDEAGQRLGLAARTVRRIAAAGDLEIVYPRRNTPRITETELNSYIQSLSSGNRRTWRNKKRKDTPASTPGQTQNISQSAGLTAEEELGKRLGFIKTSESKPTKTRQRTGRN